MTKRSSRFETPPVVHNNNGAPRTVGFELEFSGITLDETVTALQSALGGQLRSETAAEQVVHIDSLWRFQCRARLGLPQA